MRLNNKGMTTVEILMVFVIIGIISIGLFSMISTFNTKENVESAKEKVMTYKNIVTRDIEGDIIRRGLSSVSINPNHTTADPAATQFIAELTFKDGQKKQLTVYRKANEGFDISKDACETASTDQEVFYIKYGDEIYDLPDLGSSKNDCDHMTKDLRISTVDMTNKNNIFFLKVVFYHPDLSTRYYLNIITPINYGDITTSYTDNQFVDSIIKLNATSSKNGSIQSKENGLGVSRNGTIGTLTLEEKVTEGSIGISSDTGIVCTYTQGDGSPIDASKVTKVETKNGTKVKKLELKSNIEPSEAIAIHVHCSATIVGLDGVTKTDSYDGYIGNGWQEGEKYPTNVWASHIGGLWYFWAKGERVTGEQSLYWFHGGVPAGRWARYYFFTGNENWLRYQDAAYAYKKYAMALGWYKKADGKWYYYVDGRYTGLGNRPADKFAGELIGSGQFKLHNPNIDSPGVSFTFDENGKCIAGSGC